jgi:S-adenosylmethionine uptake transporter
MVLRPTLDQQQLFAGLVGLLSGITAALAYLQVTSLGRVGEPESRTVFFFSLGSAVAGLCGVAIEGLTPWTQVRWQAAAWILPIGILASGGQWCMTRAYASGSTLLVASLQYTGIVIGALYSLLLFGDQIPPLGWAGMALILASGVAATALRTRTLPGTPAEDH